MIPYLIVLDTLNSSLAGFVYVRQALEKLFEQEQGTDTQYAVIALGRTALVVQNLTRDPNAVLAALEKKDFGNTIVSSEASNFAQQENGSEAATGTILRPGPGFQASIPTPAAAPICLRY